MKKLIFGLVGIAVALYVLFVVLKPAAIAPNGELRQSPTVTATPTPTPPRQANITVTSPLANAVVTNPIKVTGMERTFENYVNWRLYDRNGNKLLEGNTIGTAPDTGQFGTYSFTIIAPTSAPKALEIWVFQYSAKDGSIVDLVKVPVTLQ